MTTGPRYPRIAFLLSIAPLLLAIPLAAQQRDDKQAATSLTVEPANTTLNTAQTQRFSAELKGAPPTTVINWAVRERGGDIGQDGVFTARLVGIYHVTALATKDGIALRAADAKVTAQYDGPAFRSRLSHPNSAAPRSDCPEIGETLAATSAVLMSLGTPKNGNPKLLTKSGDNTQNH